MSYFVGGALVVSAVGGAISSNKASKEQAKGVQKGLDQSAALANQARQDVMALFDRSTKNAGMGMKAALDYYKTAAPKRALPYLQGNRQAQTVLGQGAIQANNAILGLPVDMSFTQQPQIVPGTDHLAGAQIPQYEQGVSALLQPPQQQAVQQQSKSPSTKDILTGNSGLGGSTKKKLDSLSVGKRLVSKIF